MKARTMTQAEFVKKLRKQEAALRKAAGAAQKRHKTRGEAGHMYVNFDETGGCYVYIGGLEYSTPSQIHLSRPEAIALRVWLNKNVRGRM